MTPVLKSTMWELTELSLWIIAFPRDLYVKSVFWLRRKQKKKIRKWSENGVVCAGDIIEGKTASRCFSAADERRKKKKLPHFSHLQAAHNGTRKKCYSYYLESLFFHSCLSVNFSTSVCREDPPQKNFTFIRSDGAETQP